MMTTQPLTRYAAALIFLAFFILPVHLTANAQTATFTNPIVTSRDAPDPWMIYKDGYYYFTATTGGSIYVWKSRTITGVDAGTKVTVWTPPLGGSQSRNVWAPELHFLRNKWYIYYAADDGNNASHRMYVLEAATADPQGHYLDKGKIYDPTNDRWAIDGTVLEKTDGSLYFIWSGWPGNTDGQQNLYIAPMSNPWTISGSRVMLSTPNQPWEWWINEAPQVLQHDGKIFIVYSANGSWTPNYCLGTLTNTDGNLLNAGSWVKSNFCAFGRTASVFGPGHSSFVKSPDGTEDWMVYHATPNPGGGWTNRKPRAQRFTWNPDGTPNFGYPAPPSVRLAVPAGEAVSTPPPNGSGTGLTGEYYNNEDFTDLKFRRTDATINYTWGLIGNSPGAPDPSMEPDTFSVRWQGQIQPRYSETYTFNTFSDDGVRLWIDNKLIIDNWTNHTPTVNSGTVTLVAGQRYDMRLDYYEHDSMSVARLEWTSASQPLEVIPRSQLYPAATPGPSVPTVSITAPSPGSTLIAPAQVTISANAGDNDGTVSKVEFFLNGIKLGEDTTAPYTMTWNTAAAGDYTLTAKATDNSGLTAISLPVNITVAKPPTNVPRRVQALPLRLSEASTSQRIAVGGMARAFITLSGTGLGSLFTERERDGNWPSSLGGLEISVGTRPALPISLVPVTDSTGISHALDFAVPDDAAAGADIIITVKHPAMAQSWSDNVEVVPSYPAFWATNGTAIGTAIAQDADYFLVFSADRPAPVDNQTRIVLYATGIRALAAANALAVQARAGERSIMLPVDYAGPQGGLPGLDMIIVRLPVELSGMKQVSISVGGEAAEVSVPIQ